jgi:hypothetical protein
MSCTMCTSQPQCLLKSDPLLKRLYCEHYAEPPKPLSSSFVPDQPKGPLPMHPAWLQSLAAYATVCLNSFVIVLFVAGIL